MNNFFFSAKIARQKMSTRNSKKRKDLFVVDLKQQLKNGTFQVEVFLCFQNYLPQLNSLNLLKERTLSAVLIIDNMKSAVKFVCC